MKVKRTRMRETSVSAQGRLFTLPKIRASIFGDESRRRVHAPTSLSELLDADDAMEVSSISQ